VLTLDTIAKAPELQLQQQLLPLTRPDGREKRREREGLVDRKRWRFELLGTTRARYHDGEWIPLPCQKPVALLLYLAANPQRPHSREALAELLWPGCDSEAGRSSLRTALYSLRRLLESAGAATDALFLSDRTSLRLDPDAFTTDLQEYLAAVAEAARTRMPADRARALGQAASCYRGEFMAGFPDAWAFEERARLVTTQREVLQGLVRVHEELGDAEGALSAAREMVAVDPLWEEAHYEVMRLYAALGQPSACLRQYQELERVLREELDETPSAQVRALAEELRQGARSLVVARSASPPTHRPPAKDQSPTDSAAPAAPDFLTPAPRLPTQLTRFFGREEEIAWLTQTLCYPDVRLVTLTGPGGTGKTRLAINVAARLMAAWDGNVGFVPLADVTPEASGAEHTCDRIAAAISTALGLPPSAEMSPLTQIVEAVGRQTTLLVLDNFEHLVAEGAPLVHTLLERIPSRTCLVTSRQHLDLDGEQEFAVLPLPTPASVDLFVDRARAVRPGFQLNETNAMAVAALCDRLEGLPLALELAAAWVRTLTPAQILQRLSQRFELLVGGRRNVAARHQSLRAAIEWSYQLLTAEQRRFFARLSVFRGGWTLSAAEAVTEEPEALSYLQQLQECSLVVAEESGEAMRYRLLETLREFAAAQVEPEKRRELERRHATFFLALAQRADVAAESKEGAALLQEVAEEYDNLRAALDGCLQSVPSGDAAVVSEDVELGLALAAAMGYFWLVRAHHTEGRQYLKALLSRSGTIRSRDRARALVTAGRLAAYQSGAFAASHRLLEEGLALARALDDRPLVASTLLFQAELAYQHLTAEQCEAYCEEALALCRELGDRRGMAVALITLGLIARDEDGRRARAFYEEGVASLRELGSSATLAWACFHLRNAQYLVGEYEAASEVGRESLPIFQQYGEAVGIAVCHDLQIAIALARGDLPSARLHFERHRAAAYDLAAAQAGVVESSRSLTILGDFALAEGDIDAAEASYQRALAIARELNDARRSVQAFTGLGRVLLRRGDPKTAASCFVESLSLDRTCHDPLDALACLEGVAYALILEAGQAGDPGPPATAAAPSELLRAARILGAAEAARDRIGIPRRPREQSEHDNWVAALSASLGDAAFTAAWEAGRALSREEAMACALSERA
jgi:predicted ATPase/DNA-binding SARP family transcriptional activator